MQSLTHALLVVCFLEVCVQSTTPKPLLPGEIRGVIPESWLGSRMVSSTKPPPGELTPHPFLHSGRVEVACPITTSGGSGLGVPKTIFEWPRLRLVGVCMIFCAHGAPRQIYHGATIEQVVNHTAATSPGRHPTQQIPHSRSFFG